MGQDRMQTVPSSSLCYWRRLPFLRGIQIPNTHKWVPRKAARTCWMPRRRSHCKLTSGYVKVPRGNVQLSQNTHELWDLRNALVITTSRHRCRQIHQDVSNKNYNWKRASSAQTWMVYYLSDDGLQGGINKLITQITSTHLTNKTENSNHSKIKFKLFI